MQVLDDQDHRPLSAIGNPQIAHYLEGRTFHRGGIQGRDLLELIGLTE